MKRSGKQMVPVDLRRRIYHGLVSLADHLDMYEAHLSREGFAAYEPLRNWTESFAENSDDIIQFRVYLKGAAQEHIGNAGISFLTGRPWPPDDYVSPLMLKLRAWRDCRNGVDIWRVLESNEPSASWKTEMCACLANRQRLLLEKPETRQQERQIVSDMRLCFEQEASRAKYAVQEGGASNGEIARNVEIAVEKALSDFGPSSGFAVIEAPGSKYKLLCSREIADGWQLRFDASRLAPRAWGPLALTLYFCKREFKGGHGSDEVSQGMVLPIRYEFLAPYGFPSAYSSFRTVSQVYRALHAHLRLLEMVMEHLVPLVSGAIQHPA